MLSKEKITLPLINFGRKHLRNTWVHRIPLTSWIYQKSVKFTFSGTPEKKVTFRGKQYVVPTKDTTIVPSMISGDYEKFELNLFAELIKKGSTVLDIGANVGVYSLEASDAAGAKGHVYAFEPIEENRLLLEQNISLNNAKNISVVPKAIGDSNKDLEIYIAKNSIGTHSAGLKTDTSVTVQMTTIDSFVSRHKLKVDMIKIDIEGFEDHAIRGGKKTLSKQSPILFLEFSAKHLELNGVDPKKHTDRLLSLYKYCYLVEERGQSVTRITKADEISSRLNDNLILSPRQLTF